jgi:hypothetical protein
VTADQRVTAAREYLTHARKYKVAELPPAVLAREDAELRRLLGQVLDVVREMQFTLEDAEDLERARDATHVDDGGVWLTPPDALVLAKALADAIAYRDPGPCADCAAEPGGLCHKHAEGELQADAYAALARTLGIEVPRG